ncbi:MAG TPA: hypothetical protein VFQ08_08810 [Gaiella sp.]|nr:hypothetical protein [Gaiella sp.]
MATGDHHSAYLARALAALELDGRARVEELLGQLAEAARADERVVAFATARRAEVTAGRVDLELPTRLTEQEIDVQLGGYLRIRDQEPRDDVSDWANAVVALLEDALNELKEAGRG